MRSSRSVDQVATVDDDVRTGDVGGLTRGQEQAGIGRIGAFARATQGHTLEELGPHLRVGGHH